MTGQPPHSLAASDLSASCSDSHSHSPPGWLQCGRNPLLAAVTSATVSRSEAARPLSVAVISVGVSGSNGTSYAQLPSYSQDQHGSDVGHISPLEVPVARLLEAAKGDRLEPLIVLMLGTGLRRGEALALHWSDVDLAAGHVRVRWTLSRIDRHLIFDEPKTDSLGGLCRSPPPLPPG
jgi:hypothetical protein